MSTDASWLIFKEGRGYYRAGWCGYTDDLAQAGRYTRADADAERDRNPNGIIEVLSAPKPAVPARPTISAALATGGDWAIVEIMGHRRHAGVMAEVERFGARMLRVDVPGDGDDVAATHFYAGSALFSITPTDEATARRIAEHERPRPAARSSWLTYHQPEPEPIDLEDEPDDDEPADDVIAAELEAAGQQRLGLEGDAEEENPF